MKQLFCLMLFLLNTLYSHSQSFEPKVVDSLYKEDQFYIGISYNLLRNKPDMLFQNGFSLGFHLGFIKDMPINKKRNIAIGLGLGYSANSFTQNLFIDKKNSNDFSYNVIVDRTSYSKNKFSNHLIEVPIEFRWRTSTAAKYNFWRVYTGVKLGYVLANTIKYKGDLGTVKYNKNEDFNNVQYGLTFCAGYNTWNLYLYYALNPIFSNKAQLNNSDINMNNIKIGLMFYVL